MSAKKDPGAKWWRAAKSLSGKVPRHDIRRNSFQWRRKCMTWWPGPYFSPDPLTSPIEWRVKCGRGVPWALQTLLVNMAAATFVQATEADRRRCNSGTGGWQRFRNVSWIRYLVINMKITLQLACLNYFARQLEPARLTRLTFHFIREIYGKMGFINF